MWLNVLPISSLGLGTDNSPIRVAVGLRLGAHLCRPHTCRQCSAEVDSVATHGLSCRWSEGHHHRHAAVNDIIHRAPSSAKIPSHLEPSGLYCSDGKCPDGISVVPWKSGKLLVWDATCPDTFAPSYEMRATCAAGAVAALAEVRKEARYTSLCSTHVFTTVAIETSGGFGPKTLRFIRELGRRIVHVTAEVNSTNYLMQRLAVAVQLGNSAAVLGTMALPDFTYLSLFHFLSSLYIIYLFFNSFLSCCAYFALCWSLFMFVRSLYYYVIFMFVCPFGAGHILS